MDFDGFNVDGDGFDGLYFNDFDVDDFDLDVDVDVDVDDGHDSVGAKAQVINRSTTITTMTMI